MSSSSSCAYTGIVIHKRLSPKQHAFSYKVFSLALDVDEIDDLDKSLRFFSRNRWNILSFHDHDHGSRDRSNIGEHVRGMLREAGLDHSCAGIVLLCYPRLLGFAFNPLSVYFCYRQDGRLGAIVYEVSNTFRERRSYLIPLPEDDGGTIEQSCSKEMYVSPFTSPTGSYRFHVHRPGPRVLIGVDFHSIDGPVLKTYFRGDRYDLSDWGIVRLVCRHPLMTIKVVVGIHFEAARLWLKGVPLAERRRSVPFSSTVVQPSTHEIPHV
jgi:uncharacterized protein